MICSVATARNRSSNVTYNLIKRTFKFRSCILNAPENPRSKITAQTESEKTRKQSLNSQRL